MKGRNLRNLQKTEHSFTYPFLRSLHQILLENMFFVIGIELNVQFSSFHTVVLMITISQYGRQTQQCFTKPDYRMSLLVDYMFRSIT